ncbi:MAG: adenylyl-sulfate kinase [candidate division WOR-3 bacterium]
MKNINNIVWHKPKVTREMRNILNGHKSFAFWFTGLPSSGKSTIAHLVEKKLYKKGVRTYTFDGDNIRLGLCSDLGFSEKDREENLRRVAEVINLFLDAGIVVLAAFVSPLKKHRDKVKQIIGRENFAEIYCRCPVEICEMRDPKGMYKKARIGEIKEYTGISAPYEEPENPDLIIDTHLLTLDEAVEKVYKFIESKILLSKENLP